MAYRLAGGAPLFTQADTLNRSIRAWEGSSLGEDDILIPPFTALTIAKSAAVPASSGGLAWKIGAVARTMTLTDVGLWDSVSIVPPATPRDPKPAPIEILQRPIELVTEIGGRRIVAAAIASGSANVTKATPTVVETQSEWAAGALSGSLQMRYDPDGCAKVELTLAKVHTSSLHIPLLKAYSVWRLRHSSLRALM